VEVAGVEPASFGDLILKIQPCHVTVWPVVRCVLLSPLVIPSSFRALGRLSVAPQFVYSAAPWPLGSVVCLLDL